MKRRQRLVILNPTCLEVIESHRADLDASGVEWIGGPELCRLREADVDAVLGGANALVLPAAIRNLPLAAHMRTHASIRVLSIAASGYDWLDVEAATASGIVVTFAPAREGVEVVADMAFALMLGVARQIPHHHNAICGGCYDRGMGVMLWGKTLGIVGLGRIGSAVARRAAGFDMRILAADPAPDPAVVRAYNVELVPLERLLRESDVVSLHVRLNRETDGMIGAAQLRLMKPGAILVNTARRELVDEAALAAAILEGRLGGAGLDDPPARPDTPLLGRPNVIFAPHHGNRAIEGVHAVFRLAIDNALAVLRGQRPEYVVNPAVYEGPLRSHEAEAPAS